MVNIETSTLERLTAANPGPPDFGGSPRGAMLIVDDDPSQANILARKLCSAGVTHIALSATQALKAIERNPEIAVVITDLRMPGFDGEWLIDRIRASHPRVRIVCVSAYHNRLERLKLKTDACFDKPVRLRDLALMVSMLALEAGLP